MISTVLTEERLRGILRGVDGASVVVELDGQKLIAIVISNGFAGKEEFERQDEVWGLLIEELTDDELAQVGFVFTNTPDEAEAEGGEVADPPPTSGTALTRTTTDPCSSRRPTAPSSPSPPRAATGG
jgi:acid stress-induced BolA-like protein IbaG/YrbA